MKSGCSILILIPGFPADETDTDCVRFPQQCVLHLAKQFPSCRITVFTFQYPFEAKHYDWHGIKVYAFGGQNRGKIQRILLWNKILKAAYKQQHNSHFTGILSFWLGECAFIGNIVSRKFDIPHYCYLLGQDVCAGNKYMKWLNPAPGALIAISDHIRDECGKNYHIIPAQVIPLGIDPAGYPVSSLRDIDLLAVGSLISLKRLHIFIDIISEVKKTYPGIRAAICGEGPLRAQLEKQVKSLGLEENVTFTGKYPHGQVLELMSRSRILFHPSSYEGFSTVCAEALYAGAHVVSFCTPMHQQITHFHTVQNHTESYNTISLLLEKSQDHSPVLYRHINDTVGHLMELFIRPVSLQCQPMQHIPALQSPEEIKTP